MGGVYQLDGFGGIDVRRKQRWFQRGSGPNAGLCRVRPELQALVEFRPLNLLASEYRLRGGFAAIFCNDKMFSPSSGRGVPSRAASRIRTARSAWL